jgi:hypothetical protein
MPADEMRALDAVVAGADRAGQVVHDIGRELRAVGEKLFALARRELGQKLSAPVAHAFRFHEEYQLVRRKPHRNLCGNLLEGQVEDLPGRRVSKRRHEDEVAIVEALPKRLDVDAAHFSCQPHVDAVDDTDGLGGDEVTADHADARARHRRIGDAERE